MAIVMTMTVSKGPVSNLEEWTNPNDENQMGEVTISQCLHMCVCTCMFAYVCVFMSYDNAHTIHEIWYCKLMHYDMCVIVGIPKSVYPLHVHMK